jgi:hypothetical protein
LDDRLRNACAHGDADTSPGFPSPPLRYCDAENGEQSRKPADPECANAYPEPQSRRKPSQLKHKADEHDEQNAAKEQVFGLKLSHRLPMITVKLISGGPSAQPHRWILSAV